MNLYSLCSRIQQCYPQRLVPRTRSSLLFAVILWALLGWTNSLEAQADPATPAEGSAAVNTFNVLSSNTIDPQNGRSTTTNAEMCYPLSLTYSGEGSVPFPSPLSSDGCPDGNYMADEVIRLTAEPASGWRVAGWSGTDDNSSVNLVNQITMPDRAATAGVTYELAPTCYPLTLSRTGSGSEPAAQPGRSSDCSEGQYVPGQSISLTAEPAVGWSVQRWFGTNDDDSTATTNSMTMPARSASAGVVYVPVCYTLTRTHSGGGDDPVATPDRSADCPEGRYYLGEVIQLQAAANAGWRVAGWSGTSNDESTSDNNFLIMPAADASVGVRYERKCFALSRNHAGEGSDPGATPDRSEGCPVDHYLPGTVVTLSADPADGWAVARWSGTDDDDSTALFNTLTMPAATAVVIVVYREEAVLNYSLTITVEGNGFVRKAPDKPEYAAGEQVILTAVADPDWIFEQWTGDIVGSSNQVTVSMESDLIANALFVPAATCFALTLERSGEGAAPVALPNSSTGCIAGEFVADEAILLTAAPASDWQLVGWRGTDNDASTNLQNSLVMPADDRTVTALYLPEGDGVQRAFLPLVDRAMPPPPFPVLTNGNFDSSDRDGWSESSGQGLQLIVSEQYVATQIDKPFASQSSPNLAWLGGISDDQAEIAQSITLPAGVGPIRLVFYHWIGSLESRCGDDLARVLADEAELRAFDLCRSSNTNGWQRVELSLDAQIGETVALRFVAAQDGDEVSNWYIDSVLLCNDSSAQPCE